MNDTDLFILSRAQIIDLIHECGGPETEGTDYINARLKEVQNPIDPAMNHVCELTTEIHDNGSLTLRMLRFARIRSGEGDHKTSSDRHNPPSLKDFEFIKVTSK